MVILNKQEGCDMKTKCHIIALLIILALILCACADGTASSTWQEQYDLGVRYLSEGNYREAVIVFTTAIQIDPRQADAYLLLADAYLAVGDTEAAMAALQQGFDNTGDERLLKRLEESGNSASEAASEATGRDPVSSPKSKLQLLFDQAKGSELLAPESLSLFGHGILSMDFDTYQSILSANGFFYFDTEVMRPDSGDMTSYRFKSSDAILPWMSWMEFPSEGEPPYVIWGYHAPLDWEDNPLLPSIAADIRPRDSVETVFAKWGLHNAKELAAAVNEMGAQSFSSFDEVSDSVPQLEVWWPDQWSIYISSLGDGTWKDGSHCLGDIGFAFQLKPRLNNGNTWKIQFHFTSNCQADSQVKYDPAEFEGYYLTDIQIAFQSE